MQTPSLRILILCTGNSCRSQMAHGLLQQLAPGWFIRSAGTAPAERVHPAAVDAMAELGIDIGGHRPHNLAEYLDQPWDCVITVCDNARERCPLFTGTVRRRFHMGFDDPARTTGAPEAVQAEFRRVRDEIRRAMQQLHEQLIHEQA